MNKFEQLIEYVINDEEAKARELFHDIVVEKSRQIYEEMMQEEEHDDEEKVDESADEDIDEGIEEALGGDQADDLIDDIETEEQGLGEADDDGDDEEGEDHHADVGGEEELEDRVVDLEDKLDELMAEFEALMGGDDMGGDDMGGNDMDMDMDVDMDSEEVVDDEFETEGMAPGMMEAVSLKAAPKPVTSEEGGINKKSTVAANAGAKGPVGNTVKPVSTGSDLGGHHDAAAYKNTTKELIGRVGNTPAQSTQEPKAAPKPHLAQATGVNTKSILKKV
jgi:hypothetical protein